MGASSAGAGAGSSLTTTTGSSLTAARRARGSAAALRRRGSAEGGAAAAAASALAARALAAATSGAPGASSAGGAPFFSADFAGRAWPRPGPFFFFLSARPPQPLRRMASSETNFDAASAPRSCSKAALNAASGRFGVAAAASGSAASSLSQ